ncbi:MULTISPECIES: DUF4342 domain-containing protein [Clostridium]|uniref:DUF4342 domain-containing protein n=1 Tax=Clostridium frigoriphilum TaxID=443253 RepID=A0ABU7UID4_9CLOT|nr:MULTISPECIES: DUF4342 domain-containing protein [Clostridium]MBU3098481.1 DUF4342 domain-containing protein [Clostridium sp. DSM 17811]MBX4258953.1 DUF4342 domain-containing protein [Clostridium estertheticum]MCB2354261.1 DUF4342 domain-containing protein [Clostridium estertheticum]MCB2359795.1 DUF4342 domain-containing protein [Clostridium estertheticum]WAG42617.1 DUF4342 domain-containing protein [Clostridium estertheticum]
MEEITLEKIDIIKERTGVSYTDAKEALEECDANVVDALIYIEAKEKKSAKFNMDEMYTTKDEFLSWIKEIARKGNVTRIKIKRDDKVVIDIPVNAGIAVGIVGLCIPYLFGIGIFAAVVTNVTIEITKADGSVEIINTIIKNTVDDVVNKMSDMGEDVKEKYNETKDSFSKGNKDNKDNKDTNTDNVYQYTVKFEEKDKEEDKKEDIENENIKEDE